MRILVVLILFAWTGIVQAQTISTDAGPARVERVIDGLDVPWAIDFLPDGSVLVTELSGELLLWRDGETQTVSGVPRVWARGQGGLLDVMVPRDFSRTQEIFLTYAKDHSNGAATAVAVARLSTEGARLENARTIFEASSGNSGGRHFGSRVIEAPDGKLFVTIGERGDRPSAQDLSRHNGSVIRVNRDGTVPSDNPFTGQSGAQPEIWSFGHRNPQGASFDKRGGLWVVEHGARGGDEVNRVQKGYNYGWPVISYGRHYSGAKIGEGTSKPGMEQPEFYWDPSIAPSGMTVYSGKLWPEWRGDLLVGSLKFDMISRLSGSPLREVERIEADETLRIRDVVEAPDGAIWFASEGQGAVFRITPAN
ncbi:PQQ-dependent sugar dehydrogenase [Lutimaribacter marinistellae]|uniref:PQQ-dependent sugar dehydrogenase n=1 Tax=Lutimaribacter marinistellae TaxID=1820329 RepID=A0ABV7TMT1_9RHOB